MGNRILLVVAAAVLSLAFGSTAFAAPYTCSAGDTAEARDDVDVYNSPVEPRAPYENYFIEEGTKAPVLARHEDGWCQLKGVAPGGGDGWVAEDHLMAAAAAEPAPAPAPAGEPIKYDCKDLGPNEGAAGGAEDPKLKFECEPLGGGNKRCCWVKYP